MKTFLTNYAFLSLLLALPLTVAAQEAPGSRRDLTYSRAEADFQFAQLKNVDRDFLFATFTRHDSAGLHQFRASSSQEQISSRLRQLSVVTCLGRRR